MLPPLQIPLSCRAWILHQHLPGHALSVRKRVGAAAAGAHRLAGKQHRGRGCSGWLAGALEARLRAGWPQETVAALLPALQPSQGAACLPRCLPCCLSLLYLAVSPTSLHVLQSVVDPRTDEVVSAVTGQADTVSAQQIVQLGMFSIITYAVELTLEYGIVASISTILVQLLQGGWQRGGSAWG